MALIDPESTPSDRRSLASGENTPSTAPNAPELHSGKTSRRLVFGIVAGLIAGAVSLLAGEFILKAYESDLVPKLKIRPTADDFRRFNDARLYSATLNFTTMGGLLGLMMGLAGGLARRSASASARGAIPGLVVGTAAAAAVSWFLLAIFFKNHDPQSGDLILPLLTHGAIWSTIGAVGGLAFGLGIGGRGRWSATLMGGLAGAAAATVVYELVGALAFASDKTDQPLSSSITTRAMAQLLVAICSAVGAVVALSQSRTTAAVSAEPSRGESG
jgi:hypothetical protein